MTDNQCRKSRSQNMSRIRGKDTKPERIVRSALHSLGFRFRIHRKDLPGTPDIVLPKYRTAILVHGCFWHGHSDCKRATIPSTRPEFWKKKIGGNKIRDEKSLNKLRELGYNVVVVWGCEISSREKATERLERLVGEIRRTGEQLNAKAV